MLAFHNDHKLQREILDRVDAHRAAGEIVRGSTWDPQTGRGGAIGCALDAYDHALLESQYGIPVGLAYLVDIIDEIAPKVWVLPRRRATPAWPQRFLRAIPLGADLSSVWSHFAVWLLEDELAQWRSPEGDAVIALYRRRLGGDEPPLDEWRRAARVAADVMNRDAKVARAKTTAHEVRARRSAADRDAMEAWAAENKDRWRRVSALRVAETWAAATWAAATAARAWWDSEAERAASYQRQGEKLLELLASAPVPGLD